MNNAYIYRRQVEDGPHTVWVDNFSKTLGRQLPSIEHGAWSNCLWTGVALKKYEGPPLTLKTITDDQQEIIPAMPEDPFEYEQSLRDLWNANVPQEEYIEKSLMTRWSVCNVPPKPVIHRVRSNQIRDDLKNQTTSLANLYPKKLIAINIGSNIGLGKIIRAHYEEKKQHQDACDKYTAFNVDINIFDRMIKV